MELNYNELIYELKSLTGLNTRFKIQKKLNTCMCYTLEILVMCTAHEK